ncbi:MAG: LysM peptidoglycan-binding domain-containing protein [Verrucomicrobiota bacterium]
MKWLFALLLALGIFGGAYYFSKNVLFRQELAVREEHHSAEVAPAQPTPDNSMPEFEAAAKLKQDGKLLPARDALTAFIQKYPNGAHFEEAKDLLGAINTDLLLSPVPSPEKQEYIVKKGDVIARVAQKMKSTPELIMRTNHLNGTMLHVGERLLISHPEFVLFIQTQAKLIVLLNQGNFFKQYHIREVKLPPGKQPSRTNTRVAEVMAWKGGKRVGFGTREYQNSTRWVRLAAPGYTIYAVNDAFHPATDQPAPSLGLGINARDAEELSSLVNGKTPVTITE